jgi:hypothetical protein
MLEAGSSKNRVAAPAAAAATSLGEEAETIKSVRLRIDGTLNGKPLTLAGLRCPLGTGRSTRHHRETICDERRERIWRSRLRIRHSGPGAMLAGGIAVPEAILKLT